MVKREPDAAKDLKRQLDKLIDQFIGPRTKSGKRAKADILEAAEAYQKDRRIQIALHRKGAASQLLKDLQDALTKADEAVRGLVICFNAYSALASAYRGDKHWQVASLGDDDAEPPHPELIVLEPTRSPNSDIADLLRATREVRTRWRKEPPTPADYEKIILISRLMGIGRDHLGIKASDTRDDPAAGLSETNNTCAFFIREVFSILGPHYALPALPKELHYWLTPALRHLKDPYGNELN